MKKNLLASIVLVYLFCDSAQAQTLQWAKSIGYVGIDYSQSLTVDNSGNIITAGVFSGTVDFDPDNNASFNLTANSASGIDVFVAKYDGSGIFLWAVNIGAQLSQYSNSIAASGIVKCDNSGNIYLCGNSMGQTDFDPGPGLQIIQSPNTFVLKLNSSGNFVWVKTFDSQPLSNQFTAIDLDAVGNIIVAGEFQGIVDCDPGPGVFNLTSIGVKDAFVVKLSSSGNLIWAKNIGGSGQVWFTSAAFNSAGDVFLAGNYIGGVVDMDPGVSTVSTTVHGNVDMMLICLSSSGNFMWGKDIGGGSFDFVTALDVDINSNVFITGMFSAIVDFDPSTSILNILSGGYEDAFLAKYTSSGTIDFAYGFAGTSQETSYNVCVDPLGNAIFTGRFGATIDFDPGPTTLNTTANGTDIYVVSISNNGLFNSVYHLGSAPGLTASLGLGFDNNGCAIVSGYFYSAVDFDLGPSQTTCVALGYSDAFLMKVCSINSILPYEVTSEHLSIYPNPSIANLNVNWSGEGVNTLTLSDATGRTVRTYNVSGTQAQLSLEGLASGVYFLSVNGEEKVVQKIIKQ